MNVTQQAGSYETWRGPAGATSVTGSRNRASDDVWPRLVVRTAAIAPPRPG